MTQNAPIAGPSGPRRAQMGRYALWQARDYLFERGLPTMIVVGLSGFVFGALPLRELRSDATVGRIPRRLIEKHGSVEAAVDAMVTQGGLGFLGAFLGAAVFLGALFAMNGLVSNDRKNGFYKFLFAKPVTPERYYGQAFIVNSVGFMLVALLLAQIWNSFVIRGVTADMMIVVGLLYLCYAGIAFLLTAAARWDWLSLVVVAVVSTELWERYGASTHPLGKLVYLLPPLTETNGIYAAATQHLPLPWKTLAWLSGYGIACYLAGLVVLRHRRLATP
jgi:hypothetical protein